jgi:MFS family permease
VAVFVGYTLVAVVSTLMMVLVKDYPISEEERRKNEAQSVLYKSTVTFRLLISDAKMKYMVLLCAAFSLSSVFITTFVNAEVIRVSLGDDKSAYVGFFTSVTAAVGGIMSVVFGYVSQRIGGGNGFILVIGCMSFFIISFLFAMYPDFSDWHFSSLLVIYALQGIGRATFEGTLKAEFATVFQDKEAAFGNIIFQNGLVTSLGFSMVARMKCSHVGDYCIEFEDGSLHNIFIFEVLVMIFAALAVAGYFVSAASASLSQAKISSLNVTEVISFDKTNERLPEAKFSPISHVPCVHLYS